MDKSELLLKNFSILSKNPRQNSEALISLIQQLCEENPQMAIRCWHEILLNNIDEMKEYWGKSEYPYENVGYPFVYECLVYILGEDCFKFALLDFVRDKELLDVLYTKSFFDSAFRLDLTGAYVINYLLRNGNFESADLILAAIYKNKTFSFYDKLWENIIKHFNYVDSDLYSPSGVFLTDNSKYKQDDDVQNFCLEWVERIPDEEQKAAAMTFVMRIL